MGKKDPHALFDEAPDHHALFDAAPDAPKAAAAPAAAPEQPGFWESAARGAGQGVTGSFGDEINGAIQAVMEKFQNGDTSQAGFWDRYRKNRDTFRREDQAANDAHGTGFMLGNVLGGSVLAPILPGGQARSLGQLMKVGAALGGANALGNSSAELTWDQATSQSIGRAGLDTATGGVLGAGAGALGYGVQQGMEGLGGVITRQAATRAGAAEAKNAELAGAKVLEEVRQGAQKSATANADLNRQTERIQNGVDALKEMGVSLSPEQEAAIKAAQAKSAQKALERLPSSVSESDAAGAALQDILANKDSRAAELLAQGREPSMGKDAWELFRSYGEPVLGAAAGSWAGNALGGHGMLGGTVGTLGGLIFGRTRAGKALATRWSRPGNQLAMARGQAVLGNLIGGSAPLATGLEGSIARNPSLLGLSEGAALSLPQLAELFGQSARQPSLSNAFSAQETP